MSRRTLDQSSKLKDVLYEIRGPVLARANQLEAEGHRILKLNIGNPAPFGFEAPDIILQDVIAALPTAQNIYVHASRFDRATTLARDTILLTTTLSVPMIVGIAYLLG